MYAALYAAVFTKQFETNTLRVFCDFIYVCLFVRCYVVIFRFVVVRDVKY